MSDAETDTQSREDRLTGRDLYREPKERMPSVLHKGEIVAIGDRAYSIMRCYRDHAGFLCVTLASLNDLVEIHPRVSDLRDRVTDPECTWSYQRFRNRNENTRMEETVDE